MDNINVKDLPEWLQKIIRKKLSDRMSAPDMECLMNGTVGEITAVIEG